jgi:hypothetical protein
MSDAPVPPNPTRVEELVARLRQRARHSEQQGLVINAETDDQAASALTSLSLRVKELEEALKPLVSKRKAIEADVGLPAAAVEAPSAERVRNNPYAPDGVPSSERDEIGNGWVKRSERLPTVGGTYLVGAYDDTTPLPRTFVRFWASFFLFDAGPEWQILDAEHEHRTVEYWIDLPPHPEHPGRKPAVRADRDDIIEMCARTEPTKYDLVPGRYQKRTLIKRISYVLTGGQFGIEPGYVVLGLSDPEVTP